MLFCYYLKEVKRYVEMVLMNIAYIFVRFLFCIETFIFIVNVEPSYCLETNDSS